MKARHVTIVLMLLVTCMMESSARRGKSERCYHDNACGDPENTRYYYDSSTNTCKQFQCLGCGGNRNMFKNVEDCVQVCVRPVDMIIYSRNSNEKRHPVSLD
nr:conotoxin precursor conkunitzin [Conus judaeus]